MDYQLLLKAPQPLVKGQTLLQAQFIKERCGKSETEQDEVSLGEKLNHQQFIVLKGISTLQCIMGEQDVNRLRPPKVLNT